MLLPIRQILERLERGRQDSDVAYFFELLTAGELILKLATVGLLACLEDDRERHRYRLEFALVHADGLGAWSAALDDALTGPASQSLAPDARSLQRELTQTFRIKDHEWQAEALKHLHNAQVAIDQSTVRLPTKAGVRRWFADFVALRNRTRGHGATTPSASSDACEPLQQSITLILEGLSAFRWQWAHLHRNLSGKYRVSDFGNGIGEFEKFKSSKDYVLQNGVYLWAGAPRFVSLLSTDDDARDCYLPNGGFNEKTYEQLSYITDTRISVPSIGFIDPPTRLPESETQGIGELEVMGRAFANLPPPVRGYVARDQLESDLASVLCNDRHPVITLVGRGGIGKTSLALQVLHRIADTERFFAMVWFSSRDIELLPEGPKLVQPHVLSPDDMAAEYVKLTNPALSADAKKFNALEYFAQALGPSHGMPTLFIFDNFETVRSPLELHKWLDAHIRLPNKILITTRSREFKGDYWVEVGGMTEGEFRQLVDKTAGELNVANLIDDGYVAELYRESDGHPYVAKVLLGELARTGRQQKVERLMASQERVLEALFERTFTQLAPAGQRIFLTLSNWRSLVPLVALDAATNRPDNERVDVQRAVEELDRSSLLQITTSEGGDIYLTVPLSAALFGRRKLAASAWRASVEADTEVLRLFGAVQIGGVRHGFAAQVERLFQNVAERLQKRPEQFDRYLPVLEFVARERPIGWVFLGQIYEEVRPSRGWAGEAADAYRRYLECVPDDGQIWQTLARVCQIRGDSLGAAQALVRRAMLSEAPFADISYAAVRINSYVAEHALELDTDEQRILITGLIDVMRKRKAEANATDLSRLAWLLINVGRRNEAKDVVAEGLDLDASNSHCRKLAVRFKIDIVAA